MKRYLLSDFKEHENNESKTTEWNKRSWEEIEIEFLKFSLHLTGFMDRVKSKQFHDG
jgi:hypothetical protein